MRIDDVYEGLLKHGGSAGITASDLARAMGMNRSNVTTDLKRLCEEGRATKTDTRPARFRVVIKNNAEQRGSRRNEELESWPARQNTPEKSALDDFALANPSLYHCVELAKAAVLYPPHGMNMLMHGPTGVGKTMFARMVYEYAVECGMVARNAPFVSFNCADYADNPQLLVSELMGTRKGAYTGAEEDRPGLIEKADGGMLFLDEVHRLPPQGQEMLFTYIDRGVYRRLGEVECERTAQVLLICATTEDPASSLLATFVRRIPIVMEIPSLAERSKEERFGLIARFFTEESSRLGREIMVSVNSIRSLLGYSCPGNIGQLRNDVRIICAQAYARSLSHSDEGLRVRSSDLPLHVSGGLYAETSHAVVWRSHLSEDGRYCIFDATSADTPLGPMPSRYGRESIYDSIDARMAELQLRGASEEEKKEAANTVIQEYFRHLANTGSRKERTTAASLLVPRFSEAASQILLLATARLQRSFGENVLYGLSAHIASAVTRLRDGLPIVNPQLETIKRMLPDEFAIAREASKVIESRFEVEVPEDEIGFLALFFNLGGIRKLNGASTPLVVVVAHGASTASSMAATANRLNGSDYALAINASLDETPAAVYDRVRTLVKEHDHRAGVLLLVDMGSLVNFADTLGSELGCSAMCIPLVSTMHVVEASRKALEGSSLEDVYYETMRVQAMLDEPQTSGAFVAEEDGVEKLYVITACTTGEGGAALMRNILMQRLNRYGICEIVSMAIDNSSELRRRLDTLSRTGKILCVVSAFDIRYPAPRISFANVFDGSGVKAIQDLVDEEYAVMGMRDQLSSQLSKFDVKKQFVLIQQYVQVLEREMGCRLLPGVRVGVLCHIACLFDRLMSGESGLAFPDMDAFVRSHGQECSLAKRYIVSLEVATAVSVPLCELCHILMFFSPENCVGSEG